VVKIGFGERIRQEDWSGVNLPLAVTCLKECCLLVSWVRFRQVWLY